MPDLGLTHVALPVTSLDASIGFYARFAGMHVVHRREGTVWLSDRTRPFVIVLIEVPEVEFPLKPFGHLGVGCASREEVALPHCARAERPVGPALGAREPRRRRQHALDAA